MNLHGLNLFPLNLCGMAIPQGYYMDANYNVYSARTGGRPLPIQGSVTGGHRYYRFSGSSANFRHDVLKNAAKSHSRFAAETANPVPAWAPAATGNPVADAVRRVQTTQAAASAPRSHAANLEAGIAGKGWIIARVDGNSLSLSSSPQVHLTDGSVRDELQRLAIQKPGTKYVSLKIGDAVVAGGITWQ